MTITPFEIRIDVAEHPLVWERWKTLVDHFGGPSEAMIAILSGRVEIDLIPDRIGTDRGYAVEFRPGAKIERRKP
jgi:hypothetical protein